ncbi:prepilin-type N-terminal cleavage/methylation domain-containing protein [Ramlibacter henchirensis]|uniref:Prepilin-type N-terminal cleavage/methylation domain-containing protein n=1 Tax=Ramlibacter henchirensis TaxID=204072 RepID=A0A4Z0BS62_9BURK|nr:type IV pilin protein [Ramlibacter henchirensis]TFZ02136.1 prepilin-type N-terminal cleavage/methylation domain-containing protein [Ramlibacter henchirensis]
MVERRSRGFTLIELMITVAIIAILSAIAYPSYTEHVRKGARRAAQAQMLDIANREQQFLISTRAYVPYATLTASGYALPADLVGRYTPSVTVGAGTVPSYTITFTAIGAQAVDGDLGYTSDGVKTPAGKW